mgnify:CR=1 FL=1
MAFRMPDRMNNDYYVADLLSDVLSMGKASRLYDLLVKRENLCLETDAYISGSIDEGMLIIEAKLKDEVNPNVVEKLVWQVINELVEKGIAPERLRAKGYQGDKPFLKGAKTEDEHQWNRRTVITVTAVK